jgi:hypothetical protein
VDPTANETAGPQPEPRATRRRPAREAATLARLDAQAWSRVTPTYRALDLDFAVRTMRDDVADYLELVLEPLRAEPPGAAPHHFSIVDAGARVRNRYAVYFDGQPVVRTPSEPQALEYVLWQLNRAAVAASGRSLLLHAGAVAVDGGAVLFPAPMDSGKSTLVAGLVARGLSYLSDEIAAIDPTTGLVEPYPRPLSIDRGSWDALAKLRPALDARFDGFVDAQWHFPPDHIRPGAVGAAVPPVLVVGVRYVDGAPTTVESITRGAGSILLAENAFNFSTHGRAGLRLIAAVVAGCMCFRLTSGSLDDACDAIIRLSARIGASA